MAGRRTASSVAGGSADGTAYLTTASARLMHLLLVVLAGALAGTTAAAQTAHSAAAPAPEWSAQEKRAIARHGPWPQPLLPDRSNRASGHADAMALGRALFFDVRLSPRGDMACATCHQPDRALSDGRDRAQGRERLDRNTPGLWNVGLGHWFGWDGAADSLWGFALRPLRNPLELGASAAHVATLLRSDATYACLHRNAFGAPARDGVNGVNAVDERWMVDAAKALAAFMATLQSGKSAFDELHDALARGDAAAAARYPDDARRGLRLFSGRGQCAVCHFGPNFTNGEFHEIGISYLIDKGRVDPGRHGGIKQVRADRYNLLGAFSDDASRVSGSRTRHVAENHANYGQFKTPSLRNVELTAPYMHNGKLATLRDVVRHYSEIPEDRLHQDGEALLKPLRLTETEANDLVAFLRTLTSKTFAQPGAVAPVCQPQR